MRVTHALDVGCYTSLFFFYINTRLVNISNGYLGYDFVLDKYLYASVFDTLQGCCNF